MSARSQIVFFARVLAVVCSFSFSPLGRAESVSPPLEIGVSLRGLEDSTVEAGEPFQVAVRVDGTLASPATVRLAPATGSWIEATAVEILSSNADTAVARARPVTTASEPVEVVAVDEPAFGLWWFSLEAVRSLAAGNYRVRARLTIRDGSGWKGEVLSEVVPLRVVAPSADPARVTARLLARARAAIVEDKPDEAARLLDAALEENPDNVPVLALRGALCLEGGNRIAARQCVLRAQALSNRGKGEPSGTLYALRQRIEAADTGVSGLAAAPWAQVSRRVFEPLPSTGSTGAVKGPVPATASSRGAATTASTPSAPVFVVPNVSAAGPVAPSSAPAIPAPASGMAANKSIGSVLAATGFTDARVAADPNGQWAAAAAASSQYGKTQYSAAKAVGAPDVPVAGNSPDAWCPAAQNSGTDWLEVSFAKPVHATEVRARQNDKPGAIAKVEAIEPDGTVHVWWEGVDPYVAPASRDIAWFVVRVPRTDYLVAKVKFTLNLAAVPGWKEIDAVQLVGTGP